MRLLRPGVLVPLAGLSFLAAAGVLSRAAPPPDPEGAVAGAPAAAAATAPAVPPRPEVRSGEEGAPPRPTMGQDELRRRFPVFPQASTEILSISEQMVSNGIPMNVAYFETTAGPVEILDFYAAHFDARGWPYLNAPDAQKVVPHPALSAMDPETMMQLSVMVMPGEKGGSNTVILSLADVHPEEQLDGSGDLPPYPGAVPLAVRTLDNEITGYTINFTTGDRAEAVSRFYREALQARGYGEIAVAGAPDEPGTEALLFARGDHRWQLRVMQDSGATLVMAVGTVARAPEEAQQ